MSEEATRAVVSRWFGALDAGDVDAAMACLDDNVRWINSPASRGTFRTFAGFPNTKLFLVLPISLLLSCRNQRRGPQNRF